MFTGIVEAIGKVEKIEKQGNNFHFSLSCDFVGELKIDQSICHNGCCLTVVEIENGEYKVTAVDETLKKTNLKNWKVGTEVNLERCLKIGERLDGHIVQGHVDQTGKIIGIENRDGSYLVSITYEEKDFTTVAQGSITINGISLTVASSGKGVFSVALIPYTWEFTNMRNIKIGDEVNLEFDIIGKYVAKLLERQNV